MTRLNKRNIHISTTDKQQHKNMVARLNRLGIIKPEKKQQLEATPLASVRRPSGRSADQPVNWPRPRRRVREEPVRFDSGRFQN